MFSVLMHEPQDRLRGPAVATALAASITLSLAGAAIAMAAETPRFVGTPSVRFSGHTVGVVVRLDRALTSSSNTEFFTGPHLRSGDRLDRVYGGNPPDSMGDRSRHCYEAEAARPEPLARMRSGGHWRLGIAIGNKTIRRTTAVTLKHPRHGDWARSMAKRLGCYEEHGGSKGLVGSRVGIDRDQVLVYKDPSKSYIGSLNDHETFSVMRLSPSGKYAYGFAYGHVNKHGWVRTDGLRR